MKELGVADHRFLGEGAKLYRDSGMMGTDPNNRPDVFWQADLEEASDLLVQTIDEVKPHVLITYDEFGGYGHPDHIQAHRVAMRAAEKSVWDIPKIYWNVMPISVIQEGIDAMKGIDSDFWGAEKAEDLPFAKDDSFVHALVDGNAYVEKKMNAMKAHATQIAVDGPFFALSDNVGLQVWGNEYYTLVKGEKSGPLNEKGYESDLFAGISL
jgi:N-acetyl-1-D-myo-inositol-2-amino-2-deoxy-alpha-D-glucopyranoside deacetylase